MCKKAMLVFFAEPEDESSVPPVGCLWIEASGNFYNVLYQGMGFQDIDDPKFDADGKLDRLRSFEGYSKHAKHRACARMKRTALIELSEFSWKEVASQIGDPEEVRGLQDICGVLLPTKAESFTITLQELEV